MPNNLSYWHFYLAARSDATYDRDEDDAIVSIVEKGMTVHDVARAIAEAEVARMRPLRVHWCHNHRADIADAGGDADLAWKMHCDGHRDGTTVNAEDFLVQELIELLDGQIDDEDDDDDDDGDEDEDEDDGDADDNDGDAD